MRSVTDDSASLRDMQIVHEFTVHFAVGQGVPINGGPFGRRGVGSIAGGWVKGERINGELVGPGADWAIFGDDGWFQIDVRAQIRTDDGAFLYLTYTGSLHATAEAMAALRGDGETQFGDNDFFTHLRLETGAPGYEWVNRTLFVGQGRMATDGVEYAVYRLAA